MTETVFYIALLVPALIVAIVFHEVAHGMVAKWLGDPTASSLGRLSFNPIRHVDPVGTLLIPGAMILMGGPPFGWAKPVPVVKQRLNNPKVDMMWVAAAGPGMNLLLALVASLALGLFAPLLGVGIGGEAGFFAQALLTFLYLNVFLAIFNLLPIPPFDGSHIAEGMLPESMAKSYAKLRNLGMGLFFLLIALIWAFPEWDVLGNTVGVPVNWLVDRYLGLSSTIAGY
jgi:Zn-dependent protease